MKTVIITGAAGGIGKATAILFANKGWRVCATDVDIDGLNDLKQLLGNEHHYSSLNVVDEAGVKQCFTDFAEANGGSIDVLVNNAGILINEDFEVSDTKSHNTLVDVNVKGVINCTHSAFPYLRKNADSCVINLGSASADHGVPGIATYSGSKFFVRGFTEAIATEWNRHGIHVCAIMPHFVSTSMTQGQEGIFSQSPITVTADDVALSIWNAAHDRSRHIWRVENLSAKIQRLLTNVVPNSLVRRALAKAAGY